MSRAAEGSNEKDGDLCMTVFAQILVERTAYSSVSRNWKHFLESIAGGAASFTLSVNINAG